MGRNNKRNNRFNKKKKSDVIRCRVHSKPVLTTESCSSFIAKSSSDNKNCENCKNSF